MQKEESTLTRLTISRHQKVNNAVNYNTKATTIRDIKGAIIPEALRAIQKFKTQILVIGLPAILIMGIFYWHSFILIILLVISTTVLAVKFPKIFLGILLLFLLFIGAMLLRHRQGNNADTSYIRGVFFYGPLDKWLHGSPAT
jgi:hypothetical protein